MQSTSSHQVIRSLAVLQDNNSKPRTQHRQRSRRWTDREVTILSWALLSPAALLAVLTLLLQAPSVSELSVQSELIQPVPSVVEWTAVNAVDAPGLIVVAQQPRDAQVYPGRELINGE